MKAYRTIGVCLLLLCLLSACRGDEQTPPSPQMTTGPATTGVASSTNFPDTTAVSDTTTPSAEDTTVPNTTSAPITTDPAPSMGLAIGDAAALAALSADMFDESPEICVTDAFVPSVQTVIDRPITFRYLPDHAEQTGVGILISTRAEGEIVIESGAAELLSSGFLTIDAPFCDLRWTGAMPDDTDVERYCNVRSYNDGSLGATLGGTGSATLGGISLLCRAKGTIYADCIFSVRGNVVYFGYPLIVGDADLQNATLYFATDGTAPSKTYDLRSEQEITLTDAAGNTRTYLLLSERIDGGLPVLQIYTDGSAAIESKTEYVHATLYVDGEAYPMKIRGRGNASWSSFPKKSYRIKLDEGASLFGLPQNRDWVLVSNYADKSLIRNCVAHAIARRLDGMEYTSTHFSVNLYLEGEYLGIYTFADKIEEGNGRLDFSPIEGDTPSAFGGMDIGFLCEVGWDFEGENVYNRDYFDAEKVVRIYVKEPESDRANTPEFLYVKNYILATEQAIISGQGWQDYIDLDSWVDWFILTELTFNTESAFYRSCYFWKREGGRLMLGPVWDFDMAFGNHYGDLRGYDGWCTTESTYQYISENWMNYLITYPEFTDALRMRWNAVKEDLRTDALAAIDRYECEIAASVEQNFLRWNIMPYQIGAGSVNAAVYNTHEKQVQYLRDFITARWNYMDARINVAQPEEDT